MSRILYSPDLEILSENSHDGSSWEGVLRQVHDQPIYHGSQRTHVKCFGWYSDRPTTPQLKTAMLIEYSYNNYTTCISHNPISALVKVLCKCTFVLQANRVYSLWARYPFADHCQPQVKNNTRSTQAVSLQNNVCVCAGDKCESCWTNPPNYH